MQDNRHLSKSNDKKRRTTTTDSNVGGKRTKQADSKNSEEYGTNEVPGKRKVSAEQHFKATKRCKHEGDAMLRNFMKQIGMLNETGQNNINESDLFFQWKSKCFDTFTIKTFNMQDEQLTPRRTDFYFTILDEISLEGLDGITLEALWKRLSAATNDCLLLNTKFKKLVWKIVCKNKSIEVYELNKPRPDLVIFDSIQCIDPDRTNITEPSNNTVNIYPYHCINDKKNHIKGSCGSYNTRTNVTKLFKSRLLEEVETYGNRIVLVANQSLRRHALCSSFSDPNLELNELQYCVLERIGRSRRIGEYNQGSNSLHTIIKDPKQLFYVTKTLVDAHMVSKQFFFFKAPSTSNMGSIYHITRLYTEQKMKAQLLTEHIVQILKEQPNYRMEYAELHKMIGNANLFRKLFKSAELKRFVRTDLQYSYRDIYPEAERSEWKLKGSEKEKTIRMVELIDPHVNVAANWCEEPEEKEYNKEESRSVKGVSFSRTLLNQAYNILFEFGLEGCSPWDIQEIMEIDFYTARAIIKLLEKRNLVDSRRVEVGKIHVVKYYPRCLNIKEIVDKHADIVNQVNCVIPKAKKSLAIMSSLLRNKNVAKSEPYEQLHSFKTVQNCKCFLQKSNVIKHYKTEMFRINKPPLLKLKGAQIVVDHLLLTKPEILEAYPNIYYEKSNDNYSYLNVLIKQDRRIITDGMKQAKELLIEALTDDFSKIRSKLHTEDPYDLSLLTGVEEVLISETHGALNVQKDKRKDRRITAKNSEILVELESFMGAQPVLEEEYTTADGYVIIVISSTPAEKKKKAVNVYKPVAKNLSARYMTRMNLILKTVIKEKAIEGRVKLKNIISTMEKEKGYEGTIDRKTMEKMYQTLIEEGFLKAYKIIIKLNDVTHKLSLMCSLDVTPEDPEFSVVLEQAKLKCLHTEPKAVASTLSSDKIMQHSITELKELNTITQPTYKHSCIMGREYGFAPKFLRMQALHEFMFYLIYDDVPKEPLGDEDIHVLLDEDDVNMGQKDLWNLPQVFAKEISWKMFISALPKHRNWENGWCLLCDLFVRMPLSLFVKIHNVRFVIPSLNAYLDHPVKKHMLIKHLPPEIRGGLLYKRAYYASVREVLNRLCYAGLLQFGLRKSRENDQIFIYLNRNAVLYDTSTSERGFHHVSKKKYERLDFKFNSLSDVEAYWYQLWTISMNTPLGSRNVMAGKIVMVENLVSKPEMLDALKCRDQRTVRERDVGYIPGDRLGAGGFDSAAWTHLKRNWLWAKQIKKPEGKFREPIAGVRKKKMDEVSLRPMRADRLQKSKVGFQDTLKMKKKVPSKRQVQANLRKKKHTRAFKVVQRKNRKSYYDKVDLSILRSNQYKRSDWSEHEDALLLLCKVASAYLCPAWRKHFIPYSVLRDVLHRICPQSKNKTSRMCQRRINWLFQNREIAEGNAAGAEYLTKNVFITQHFGKIREKTSGENSSVKESDLYAAYVYLVYYMFTHKEIRKSALKPFDLRINQDYLTPESVKRYKWSIVEKEKYYENPRNEEDIICDNIKSVIHSSLSCDENKIALAYQLYRAYQTFPPDLLKLAIAVLKTQQFLAAKKVIKNNPTADETIKVLSPYQFSCLYIYSQLTDYPSNVFPETYAFLSSLKKYVANGELCGKRLQLEQGHNLGLCEVYRHVKHEFTFDLPDKIIILNPHIDDHSELVNELALRFQYLITHRRFADDLEDENDTFSPYEGETEYNSPVKHVSPRKKIRPHVTVPEIVQKVIRAYDSQDQIEKEDLESQISRDLKVLQDDMASDDEDVTPAATPKLQQEDIVAERLQSTKEELEMLVKTGELKEVSKEASTSGEKEKDVEIIPPFHKLFNFEDFDEIPSLPEIKETMMDPTENPRRRIPYITDLSILLSQGLFPEPEFNNEEEWLSRLNSHFKVKLPKPKLSIQEDVDGNSLYKYFQEEHLELANMLVVRIKRDYVVSDHCPGEAEIEKELVKTWGGKHKSAMTFIRQIANYVLESKELGVTVTEIKAKFDRFLYSISLSDALTFLRDNNVIVQVGISSIIFVHFHYKKLWFIKSYILTPEDKEKLTEIRGDEFNDEIEQGEIPDPTTERLIKVMPWVKISGCLNLHVYKKWLGIILSYCLKFPKVPLKKLFKRFPYVKPVDIYFLLEHLRTLGCLRLCIICKSTVNLFSKMSETRTDEASIIDSFENIHVEVSITAALRLGCFMVVLDSNKHLLV